MLLAQLNIRNQTFSSFEKKTISKTNVSNLKYGELTFGKFFIKFINECVCLDNIVLDYTNFLTNLFKNIDDFFKRFIHLFLKFDLIIKNFVF